LAPGLSSSLTAQVLVQKPNLYLYTYVALVFDPHVKINGRKKRLTFHIQNPRGFGLGLVILLVGPIYLKM
jgi:hypothetical protein